MVVTLKLSATFPVILGLFALFALTAWLVGGRDLPASLLARAEQSAHVEGQAFPRVLVDAYGHRITLQQPPRRIISGMLAADEILFDLVPRERILAVTSYASDPEHSNCVEQARGLPQISNLPLEKILALEPDLVLAARFSSGHVISQMRQCGVPVFCFGRYDTLQDIRANVVLLGQAVGEEQRGQALAQWMDRVLNKVRQRTADVQERPRVLYYHLRATQGKNTIFDELVQIAGGTNVAAEAGIVGYKNISAELIPALRPDVVIVPRSSASGDEAEARAVLLEDPIWQSVQDIHKVRVHGLPRRHLDSISHHVVKAAVELAAVLHPDRVPAARED